MAAPAYIWRDARPDDLAALAALHEACVDADGPEIVCWSHFADLLPSTPIQCAVAPNGGIVAAGWARLKGEQAMLGGCVHPGHRGRGLGARLLGWSQSQAESLALPGGLLIRGESFTDAAGDLYARAGFALDFIADWLTLDLSLSLPAVPSDVTLIAWTEERSQAFYDTYIDSFRDRAGQREPIGQWFEGYGDDLKARPDLCLLALVDGQPAGLAMGALLPLPHSGRTIGWISQMGVRPTFRARGIADGLIGQIGRLVKASGLTHIGLDVNLNNPRALRVYERVGFKVAGRRSKHSRH
jgi:ribosomal protein S18 acetylase RimI-like enzyme